MKVLVTGGTGFVGREVLRELHAAGHEIFLLARNKDSRQSKTIAAQYNARLRSGNVLVSGALLNTCAGMDAVIHLVGIISEVGEQTFENVHTEGTRNLLAAAKETRVQRFLHMSALGTRPDADARYHKSKLAAEELVRKSGLDWTIFRPSIIYGPGDGFVNLFAKMIRRSPVVPIIGSGKTKFQPVPVASVALAFTKALAEPRAIRQTFDLCGAETFTLNEIVDEILAVSHRRRIKVRLPLTIAKVQAALLEFIFAKLLRKPPPLNRDQITMLQKDNVGNGQPANELFDLPTSRFREGIASYLSQT